MPVNGLRWSWKRPRKTMLGWFSRESRVGSWRLSNGWVFCTSCSLSFATLLGLYFLCFSGLNHMVFNSGYSRLSYWNLLAPIDNVLLAHTYWDINHLYNFLIHSPPITYRITQSPSISPPALPFPSLHLPPTEEIQYHTTEGTSNLLMFRIDDMGMELIVPNQITNLSSTSQGLSRAQWMPLFLVSVLAQGRRVLFRSLVQKQKNDFFGWRGSVEEPTDGRIRRAKRRISREWLYSI